MSAGARKHAFQWETFGAAPLVAILRGIPSELVPRVAEALLDGGVTTLEITMNSPDAPAQIRKASALAGARCNVGAGSVLNPGQLETALAAGASFIVTPVVQPAVISTCVRRGIPVFPGALSPSEILAAAELGAPVIKLFPADRHGPPYLQWLHDAFPDLRLMPTGGVDLESIAEYRRAGASAFGVGGPLLDKARVEAGDWAWLSARARAFHEAVTKT
jgi:2-dehydro-3-deoxyphosphogluconate aldolase/(4S)-4-hydroxy-2-oxoglutarate aldolase